jgi:hypothetical protein
MSLQLTPSTWRPDCLNERQGPTGALQSFRTALAGHLQALQQRRLRRQDAFDLYGDALDDRDVMAVRQQNTSIGM